MVQIRSWNEAAYRRYAEFARALASVSALIAGPVARTVRALPERPPKHHAGVTRADAVADLKRVVRSASALVRAAHVYEAELVSREWRV